MIDKNENLNSFFNEEQLREFKDNLNFVEQKLSSANTPSPSYELINNIKASYTRKHRTHKLYYALSSVAAMILIVLALNIIFTQQQDYKTKLSADIWQSYDLAEDDTEIYALNTEIEYIESQFRSSDTSANGELAEYISEFELELNENETDIWKG